MKATGTSSFGMAGNCGGARTTLLALPQVPEATSAVLMMLKPLTGTRSQKQTVRKVKTFVRGIPRIGKMMRGVYWSMRWRRANPVLNGVKALNGDIDVLFMEAKTVKVGRLPKFVKQLKGKDENRRLELRFLPGGATRAFQSFERQDFALEGMIDWFDRTLPGSHSPAASPPPASRPATASAAARS
jgi:hypothetical protein